MKSRCIIGKWTKTVVRDPTVVTELLKLPTYPAYFGSKTTKSAEIKRKLGDNRYVQNFNRRYRIVEIVFVHMRSMSV